MIEYRVYQFASGAIILVDGCKALFWSASRSSLPQINVVVLNGLSFWRGLLLPGQPLAQFGVVRTCLPLPLAIALSHSLC